MNASREQLLTDYKSLPIKKILEKYNISETTFRRWLVKYNIPILFKNKPINISGDVLRNLYEKEKLSIAQISKRLGVGSVRKYLIKHNIPIRSFAEGKHLIQNNNVFLSDEAKEFITGELLSDGHMTPGTYASGFQRSCKYSEYLEWMITKLISYGIACGTRIYKTKHKAGRSFSFYTKRHSALLEFRNKFYKENGERIIPKDLILTPLTCRQWFIGDGTNPKSGMFLCTDNFNKHDILLLIKLLKEKNINCTYTYCSNRIRITNSSKQKFLNYIGNCPEEIKHLYQYKWGNVC